MSETFSSETFLVMDSFRPRKDDKVALERLRIKYSDFVPATHTSSDDDGPPPLVCVSDSDSDDDGPPPLVPA